MYSFKCFFIFTGLLFCSHVHAKIEITYIPGEATYPGSDFKAKDTWLGLFCNPKGCELKSVKITAKNTLIPNSDETPSVWQILTVEKNQSPLLLIKGFTKLKQGPVKTYYNTTQGDPDRPNTPGKLEMEIKNVPGGNIRIVPRISSAKDQNFIYFLHQNGKSQRLGTIVDDGEISKIPEKSQILLWVGDLDGDGKVDLITSFNGTSDGVARELFLSTDAKGKEIVGKSINFNFFPEGPGC